MSIPSAPRSLAVGILVTPGNTVGYFGAFEHVLRAEFKGWDTSLTVTVRVALAVGAPVMVP